MPHILSEVAWTTIEHKDFDMLWEFQDLVDGCWGLSPEQCHGAFFSLRPAVGEAFEKFVEHVEDERCKL